ncbi:unnamed protein product (macronuclear) [Paramecium tetraurelia]|uniref:Uncharacterized protein n=1 Tax=Paramecium tetraurelia TaxID=5888 RepID=A0BPI5_PARTE|nr:uncharacterized protein GSPATT00005201001 [Paramecium tetraurelia]CAK60452.1 unnamed protein product [Paramecium tetraurelia]|eukprot:XP_001427850.1 hypothetical protein (macronuclear) [Paramecium tetraurelia strain d4-2]
MDYLIQDLQKQQKQNPKKIDLFNLETITNMNLSNMESIIRKYEQLKLEYQETTNNNSQRSQDDTFNSLYLKCCNEKKSKQSTTQSQKKSVTTMNTIQNKDYYADKAIHLQHKIEQHSHYELLSQLKQLELEQESLHSDYNAIIKKNERLKLEIQDNQQRVNELRELQLQLIDEFKQFN